MSSLAKKGWQQYMLQLQRHPLRTKAITAGVLAAVSDSISQKLSGIPRLQLRRLILKVLFGFAYLGPFGHFFHMLLDAIFKGKRDSKTVAKKVLLEQFTSSPWNNLLFLVYYGLIVESKFFTKNIVLVGKTLAAGEEQNEEGISLCPDDFMDDFEFRTVHMFQLHKELRTSLSHTELQFWPIAGWINHQYMPLQFRVIFQSFVACCWGIFLNLRARRIALSK